MAPLERIHPAEGYSALILGEMWKDRFRRRWQQREVHARLGWEPLAFLVHAALSPTLTRLPRFSPRFNSSTLQTHGMCLNRTLGHCFFSTLAEGISPGSG